MIAQTIENSIFAIQIYKNGRFICSYYKPIDKTNKIAKHECLYILK